MPLEDTKRDVRFRFTTGLSVREFINKVAEQRTPGPAAAEFLTLEPRFRNPLLQFPACQTACERLVRAAQHRDRVLLYSDYDCDGVVSVVIMREVLRGLGLPSALIDLQIPHRLRHGYGLSRHLLEDYFASAGQDDWPDLAIILDCGSTSTEEVQGLIARDVDVLVVDHHTLNPKRGLPDSAQLIHLNPRALPAPPGRDAVPQELLQMCAAGLTYLLAEAVKELVPAVPLSTDRFALLAGLATVADVVPLLGINRILVKRSLLLANESNGERLAALVPGLAALETLRRTRQTGEPRHLREDAYGFMWGPVLNAAGRMEHAQGAVDLLSAMEAEPATDLAKHLNAVNDWRSATEAGILNAALQQAERQLRQVPDTRILLLCDSEWHLGVVGIVASRIREAFNRPAVVCGQAKPGVWQGSARSVPDFDLGALFHRAVGEKLLLRGGGHAMAGGLTFQDERREELQAWLHREGGAAAANFDAPIVAEISAAHFLPEDWHTIKRELAPFGSGNPEPLLVVEGAMLTAVKPLRTRDKLGVERLFAFRGDFLEPGTGNRFSASWQDLELADVWWNAAETAEDKPKRRTSSVVPWRFRLELVLRSYIAKPKANKVKAAIPELENMESGSSLEPSQAGDVAVAPQGELKRIFEIRRCWRLFEPTPTML